MPNYIPTLCPWCNEDFSDWYIDGGLSTEFNGSIEFCLPTHGDKIMCAYCGNEIVVESVIVPTPTAEIKVTKGKSKIQSEFEDITRRAEWRDKITALRRTYLNIAPTPTLKCKIFGHEWQMLARSGFNTTDGDSFLNKCFAACSKCNTVMDTLHDTPDEYGYWTRT